MQTTWPVNVNGDRDEQLPQDSIDPVVDEDFIDLVDAQDLIDSVDAQDLIDSVDAQDLVDREVVPAGDDRLSDLIVDPDLLPAAATAHLGATARRFPDHPEGDLDND